MPTLDPTDACRRYGAAVLRRCRGILGDPDAAEDAAQEVFVAVLTRGGQFRGEADPASWIHRITTNVCLNRLRSDGRRSRREEVAGHDAARPTRPDRRYEAKRELDGLLQELDELDRRLLIHRYLDGMTQAEIAEVVGRSRRTVGKRLRRLEATVARRKEALR